MNNEPIPKCLICTARDLPPLSDFGYQKRDLHTDSVTKMALSFSDAAKIFSSPACCLSELLNHSHDSQSTEPRAVNDL